MVTFVEITDNGELLRVWEEMKIDGGEVFP